MTVPNTILWVGPVAPNQFGPVPSGWKLVTIGSIAVPPGRDLAREGMRPSDFRSYYATLGSDPIGVLLARGSGERLFVASFSAGHGFVERLLAEHGDDPRLAGVLLLDSFYGLEGHEGSKRFASRALRDGTPFWITTSSSKDNKITFHSGEESFGPLAAELGLGETSPRLLGLPDELPLPERAAKRGSVVWLDYAGLVPHGRHASFASLLSSRVLASSRGSLPSTRREDDTSAALYLALALGALGFYVLARRSRR